MNTNSVNFPSADYDNWKTADSAGGSAFCRRESEAREEAVVIWGQLSPLERVVCNEEWATPATAETVALGLDADTRANHLELAATPEYSSSVAPDWFIGSIAFDLMESAN
jgi:hypothetical protein